MRGALLAGSAAGSADHQCYRGELAGRGGADVDVEDLVVAEHRRVRIGPAAALPTSDSQTRGRYSQPRRDGLG